MEDLYKLLETRCVDVFEITTLDSSHNKEAILARGLISYYFSKLHPFLAKVFGTGFLIDWNRVEKEAISSAFSYVRDRYGKLSIGRDKDGFEYYFSLARRIWDYLTDHRGLISSDNPFAKVDKKIVAAMPPVLCGARLFRNGEMTMAGLLFFLAPLLSVNDRYRLIDDVTRIFAKDISFYQGEHCDYLYDCLLDYFPKSTMFASFHPFFKAVPSSPIDQLSRVLFSGRAKDATIRKEGENRYSFQADIGPAEDVYEPLSLHGTIEEGPTTYQIDIDPVLSKYDMLFDKDAKTILVDKDVLPELVKCAQRIPPFIIPLALSFFFREGKVNKETMRALGPSFVIFQNGAYYYDDRDRADPAYKPLYRTGLCLPAAVFILEQIVKARAPLPSGQVRSSLKERLPTLQTTARWMNRLWKYDMILGGEFYDEWDGRLISLSTTDVAKILSDAKRFLDEAPKECGANEMFDYAARGVKAFMSVYVTEKYANDLIISKRILDPLTVNEKDWMAAVEGQRENQEGYIPGKLLTDEAMQELSGAKPVFDTWLCEAPNGQEIASQRYVKRIERVHIVSQSGDILIKGKPTGKKEITLTVVDPKDLAGITGKDGTPLSTLSSKKELEFLTLKEMAC